MERYEVRQENELKPGFTAEGNGIDAFTDAYHTAIAISKLHEGFRYHVEYRGPDAPWGRAEIGFALNGEWRWR